MNILVTGASGFVGRELVKTLQAHTLTLAVRDKAAFGAVLPNARIVPFSGLSAPALGGIDAIVHLAARVHQMVDTAADPLAEHRAVNRDLAIKLAKMGMEAGVRKFVYISTVKVMGEGRAFMEPLTEDMPMAPEDPYGISKMEAEKAIAELFHGQQACGAVIIRIPLVYGPGSKGNVLSLLNMARRGIPLPLGSVTGKRSMIYVGNLCHALKTVVEDGGKWPAPVRTYFLSDGQDLTSGEFYAMISRKYSGRKGVFWFPPALLKLSGGFGTFLEKVSGKRIPLNREAVSRLLEEFRISSAAFFRDYGWVPPYKPEEGVAEMVKWHKGA